MIMRERSRARAWALQALYAWETRGESVSPSTILNELAQERNIAPTSIPYARELVTTFQSNRAHVEQALQAALSNWRLERLSVIDRNILRLAATEMLHVEAVPARVSIQEAIELAEKYSTHESPRFVNGVLDALMKAQPGDGQRENL
jgi:N utilization substance protein B